MSPFGKLVFFFSGNIGSSRSHPRKGAERKSLGRFDAKKFGSPLLNPDQNSQNLMRHGAKYESLWISRSA